GLGARTLHPGRARPAGAAAAALAAGAGGAAGGHADRPGGRKPDGPAGRGALALARRRVRRAGGGPGVAHGSWDRRRDGCVLARPVAPVSPGGTSAVGERRGETVSQEVMIRHDLRPGDLGRVVLQHGELYAREYGFDHRFEAYVAETLAEFALGFRPDRDRLWLAELDGELVGSVGILGR